jgi:hypothetical protein
LTINASLQNRENQLMENSIAAIAIDDPFTFGCSRQVPCFNECCRDLNQFLTPYDILRLKNSLKMTSGDFLEKYTTLHNGPETGLPIISLKPDSTARLQCPFVTSEGCRVYGDRPSSCRMYPVARALTHDPETGRVSEHFALIKESHCLGFDQNKTHTVRQWLVSQGLEPYNRYNDLLMEIISLKNKQKPGPLDIKSGRLFYLALYDLDAFRTGIFENTLRKDPSFDAHDLARARDEDTALLMLGIKYVKKSLFGVQ